jgi:hypothetical protein
MVSFQGAHFAKDIILTCVRSILVIIIVTYVAG